MFLHFLLTVVFTFNIDKYFQIFLFISKFLFGSPIFFVFSFEYIEQMQFESIWLFFLFVLLLYKTPSQLSIYIVPFCRMVSKRNDQITRKLQKNIIICFSFWSYIRKNVKYRTLFKPFIEDWNWLILIFHRVSK